MTTNHHTEIAEGADANASTFNSPLGELDDQITTLTNRAPDDFTGAMADITTNDVTTSAHGFTPKLSSVSTEYLDGNGNWSVPTGTGASVDGHIIQDEGSDLTQRQYLDFIGASVVAADGASATEVTINGAKLTMNSETLSGAKTLTDASEPIQALDPDGSARDVNLAAEAVTNPFFIIANTGGSGSDLTVKDDSPAAIDTVSNDEVKLFLSDGASWYVLNTDESDPVVGAITGLVKADGAGNISAAVADTDYQSVPTEGAFADGDKTKLDGIASGAEVNFEPSNTYRPSGLWVRKSGDNSVIQSPESGVIEINGTDYTWESQVELDVDVSGDWDTTSGTDYTTASNRAGVDFYIYAVEPASGTTPDFVLSANSTVPDGETADTSRKVGGFHCLCEDVGTIAGHDLTGYLQGDVLPESVWDLIHRPIASPEGMVWSEKAGIWVDIYLTSGTGASTASENGGTISDTRTWLDFIDDYAAVNKQMLTDLQFQIIAAGSNEETNISGSADPVTTGGHSDTAGDRMISNIGCEDCAGALWQWLETPAARADFNIGDDTGDEDDVHGWENLPGSKGSFYTYGENGYFNTQLFAGGDWSVGAVCGSRTRRADNYRWLAGNDVGGRGRSEPQPHRFL